MRLLVPCLIALVCLAGVTGCTSREPLEDCVESCSPIAADEVWSVGLDGPTRILGVDAERVYIAIERPEGSEIIAVKAATGEYQWNFRTPAYTYDISVRPGGVMIADRVEGGVELSSLGLIDGEVRWERSAGGPVIAVAPEGWVLSNRDDAVVLSDLLGSRAEWMPRDGCSTTTGDFDDHGRIVLALLCGEEAEISILDSGLNELSTTRVKGSAEPFDFATQVGDYTLLGTSAFGDLTVVRDGRVLRSYEALSPARFFQVGDDLYVGLYGGAPFRLGPSGDPVVGPGPVAVRVEPQLRTPFPLTSYQVYSEHSTSGIATTMVGYDVVDWTISHDGQSTFEVIGAEDSTLRSVRYRDDSSATGGEPLELVGAAASDYTFEVKGEMEAEMLSVSYASELPEVSTGWITVFRVPNAGDLAGGFDSLLASLPESEIVASGERWFADSGYLGYKDNEVWLAVDRCLFWIYQTDGNAIPPEALIDELARGELVRGCS